MILSDQNIELGIISPGDSSFELRTVDDEHSIFVEYLLEVDDRYDPNDFYVEVLYKNGSSENDIFQVFGNEKRLGWIFPVRAIDSKEHDYAKNEHFLPYAYCACYRLLKDASSKSNKVEFEYPERLYRVSEFYDDDAIVCIFYKQYVPNNDDYSKVRYLPSLMKYGFTFLKSSFKSNFLVSSAKIGIKPISKDLYTEQYIDLLFLELIHLNRNNNLYRFILLYQVFEILMSKIVDAKLTLLANEIQAGNKDIIKLRQSFNQLIKEDGRINKVFNNGCHLNLNDYSELLAKCNELLSNLGYDQETRVQEAIYMIRNIMVHNFRIVNITYESLMNQINDELEMLVIDMVIGFRSEDVVKTE